MCEWLAFYELDPFGEERADLRIAQLSALTYNAWRSKDAKPLSPIDFMPFTEKPEPPKQSEERQMSTIELLQKAVEAKDKKKRL